MRSLTSGNGTSETLIRGRQSYATLLISADEQKEVFRRMEPGKLSGAPQYRVRPAAYVDIPQCLMHVTTPKHSKFKVRTAARLGF